MLIQQIRRAKLREWFANRSIPSKEKSYISQLLKDGNPFGERAARRLEQTYGMDAMYLDTMDGDSVTQPPVPTQSTQGTSFSPPGALRQAIRLLELFEGADERGRGDILRLAEMLCRPDASVDATNKS